MATKTYPIGSVVQVKDLKALIIGVRMMEEKKKLVKSYLIVPYPTGYSGWEHVRVIPASEVTMISEGYRSPAADPYLNYMDLLDLAADQADTRTINNSLQVACEKYTRGGH